MKWPLGSSEKAVDDSSPERDEVAIRGAPLEDHQKSRWERSWPTIACGAGLFSDGYLNGQASLCHNGIHCNRSLTYRPQRYRASQHHTEELVQGTIHKFSSPKQCQFHRLCRYSRRTAILRIYERSLLTKMGFGHLDHHSVHIRSAQRRLLRRRLDQWHAFGPHSLAISAGDWHWVRSTANSVWSIADSDTVANIQPAALPVPKVQENSRRAIGTDGSSCSQTSRSTSDSSCRALCL